MYYQSSSTYNHELGFSTTPMVKRLLWINIGVYLLQQFVEPTTMKWISGTFGLNSSDVFFQGMVWQLVTYMFLHGGPFHLLMNMFILWMFGCEIERHWGSKEFLWYYMTTGIGAGIINAVATWGSDSATIGASGAIYGILVGYAMLFPDRYILLYFLFPIRAKYYVLTLGGLAFFSAYSNNPDDRVAHFAHLGGMVIGYFYIRLDWRIHRITALYDDYRRGRRMKVVYRKKEEEHAKINIDRLLDKINAVGYENLTSKEKELLKKASKQLSQYDRFKDMDS